MSDAAEAMGLVYPLPWQGDVWEQLLSLHTSGKLPPALLLSGSAGSGADRLALAFVQYVLCKTPSASGACGHCSGCGLSIANTHSDFKLLAPEKQGGQIKVDTVRSVIEFGHNTAQQGGYRVVLVTPAEAMNSFSANSLLKSLEEPGEKTLFILISHMPGALMATIKSRCQWIKLPEPNHKQGVQWLSSVVGNDADVELLIDAANGQPLKALAYYSSGELEQVQQITMGLNDLAKGLNSPLQLVNTWARWPLLMVVDAIYYWAVKWSKSYIGGDQAANANAQMAMQKVTEQLIQRRRNLLAGNNPNGQLLLESLLLDLAKVLKLAKR